ncbi:3-hydroxyisobutyrate dehydrogenase-like beta-hydroxyacid dehydrogenase [Rhizobium lentis]|uniref:3-hydroxyisobutyrate dehydrogenase-like beta-hydroxyacid dehydrogenase n=2 Tax=Rhizobium lentis TaxID=1138194 RepID=A0A7W8XFF4_9HYPH|nr:3-hydroxyisobutyrate dehydrogenase-like beta-hydroxyacid dehydrogenase [Rhizobium lentis]MBB5550725.1 3-hydroxyisobutyrate dehydrogenase-like beta-hydroxyacid dehydrogenase [Rhizobium lentis]MBB5561153.1 3-hydroxyisobutyrate dehydrogenase-like beta-hydroxyacid dehydrogenase [Rhizobium lentis]MBB5567844.1 3-hydroxyisobutyrate dehydrogenase-like beta-hydroxyacid dehydrogenase [Rhizobium lentis]
MGSAVARRLIDQGATVLTCLEGRSEETIARAKAAGMVPVERGALTDAELILSIVPPAEAVGVAELVAKISSGMPAPPPFIDLNAIAPKTMQAVAARFNGSRVEVLDGAIIGGPPVPGKSGPAIYISGDSGERSRRLEDYGLRVRKLDGPLGAASALKMCYAGINKGFIGLGTAVLLAASRSGAAESLKAELAESLPDVDRKLTKSIPDMYPKAYRWIAEMQEIADFLGKDDPAAEIFRGMAGVFLQLADDVKGSRALVRQLDEILGSPESAGAMVMP